MLKTLFSIGITVTYIILLPVFSLGQDDLNTVNIEDIDDLKCHYSFGAQFYPTGTISLVNQENVLFTQSFQALTPGKFPFNEVLSDCHRVAAIAKANRKIKIDSSSELFSSIILDQESTTIQLAEDELKDLSCKKTGLSAGEILLKYNDMIIYSQSYDSLSVSNFTDSEVMAKCKNLISSSKEMGHLNINVKNRSFSAIIE